MNNCEAQCNYIPKFSSTNLNFKGLKYRQQIIYKKK